MTGRTIRSQARSLRQAQGTSAPTVELVEVRWSVLKRSANKWQNAVFPCRGSMIVVIEHQRIVQQRMQLYYLCQVIFCNGSTFRHWRALGFKDQFLTIFFTTLPSSVVINIM